MKNVLKQCDNIQINPGVSVGGRTLQPSISALEEYHIPRVITCHFREPCTWYGSLIKIFYFVNKNSL